MDIMGETDFVGTRHCYVRLQPLHRLVTQENGIGCVALRPRTTRAACVLDTHPTEPSSDTVIINHPPTILALLHRQSRNMD